MARPHGPRKGPAPDGESSPSSFRVLTAVLLTLGISTCILAWQSIYLKTVLGEWHSHIASRVGPVFFAIVAGAFLPDGRSGWNPTALACSLLATLPSLRIWHRIILSPRLNAQRNAVAAMTHWQLVGRGVLLAALLGAPSLVLLSARLLSVVRSKLSNVVVSKALILVIAAALPAELQRFVCFPRPAQTLPAIISILIAISIWTLHRPRSTRRTLVWAVPIATLAIWVASSFSVPQGSFSGRNFTVLSQTRLQLDGSLLAVLEGSLEDHPDVRYRLLRLDHSIMGGYYLSPKSVAGQSIYTAFYLQLAGALLRPAQGRALQLGLGVGTAARSLMQAGITTDILELHPEIIAAAQEYFGLKMMPGAKAIPGDALQGVHMLGTTNDSVPYDYVIHDVFGGGEVAPGLISKEFLGLLQSKMKPDGVFTLNFYGDGRRELPRLQCAIVAVFQNLITFQDTEDSEVKNYVLVASNAMFPDMTSSGWVRAAQRTIPQLCGQDSSCINVLKSLPEHGMTELFVPSRQACEQISNSKESNWWHSGVVAADHWTVMRQQIPDTVWASGI